MTRPEHVTWRWDGKRWAELGWDGAQWAATGKRKRRLTGVEHAALQREQEERSAHQIERLYPDMPTYQVDAERLARLGFQTGRMYPVPRGGRLWTAVVYVRTGTQHVRVDVHQHEPEQVWRRCGYCHSTVPQAPNCARCGAPLN